MYLGRRMLSLAASAVLALGILAALSGGARACACGALIPSASSDAATAAGEQSVVWWDGKKESIDLRMLLGGRASDAAWIMPAPKGTKVTLGNTEAFDALDVMTRPRVESKDEWWPPSFLFIGGGSENAAVDPGSGVQVAGQSDVGPFRVTTLSGDDAGAVNDWLVRHGYPKQPGLPAGLEPYLDRGWNVLAVKLRPGESADELTGSLEPLRMTFATDAPVYPIQLSRAADTSQALRMYVVAPHRMDVANEAAPDDPAEVAYAGWMDPSSIGRDSGQKMFLTRYDAVLEPESIEADYTFERAASDKAFQRVQYQVDDHTRTTGGIIVLAFVALLTFLGIRGALRRWW